MHKFILISATLLVSLLLVGQASSTPMCASSKKLASCSGTDTGDSCYYKNFLSAANTCTVRPTEIDNCISYWDSSVIKSTETAKCRMCTKGKYAFTDETEILPSDAYRCKTGDDGVGNCDYPGRYVRKDGTIIRYCLGCAEDYIGQNYSAIVGSATSCTQNIAEKCPILNCENCGQSAWGTNSCFVCMKGFVVNSAGTACVATTDPNCWSVDSNSKCNRCWWPYWFQGASCLSGNLLKVTMGLVSAFVLGFFM